VVALSDLALHGYPPSRIYATNSTALRAKIQHSALNFQRLKRHDTQIDCALQYTEKTYSDLFREQKIMTYSSEWYDADESAEGEQDWQNDLHERQIQDYPATDLLFPRWSSYDIAHATNLNAPVIVPRSPFEKNHTDFGPSVTEGDEGRFVCCPPDDHHATKMKGKKRALSYSEDEAAQIRVSKRPAPDFSEDLKTSTPPNEKSKHIPGTFVCTPVHQISPSYEVAQERADVVGPSAPGSAVSSSEWTASDINTPLKTKDEIISAVQVASLRTLIDTYRSIVEVESNLQSALVNQKNVIGRVRYKAEQMMSEATDYAAKHPRVDDEVLHYRDEVQLSLGDLA
jgi:hypothetical protein